MNRSRLLETAGFNQLAKGRNGYFLYNIHDVYVGRSIEKYGEFSRDEAHFLEQLCEPGGCVIEVGANIGSLTVGLARRVGPAGQILAFEPQSIVFQALCANIALNSLANVDCHWAALGAEAGMITVPELDPDQTNSFAGLSLVGARQGRSVPRYTLDDFGSMRRLDLIKVDVQGMEAEVLQGGRRLIDAFKPYLYVENETPEKSEELLRLIDSLGYRMYWHLPQLFSPDNCFGEKENIFPGVVSLNMLCIHRDRGRGVPAPVADAEITDFRSHPVNRRT
jgi:FkbM family methyltransferase